MNHSVEIEKDSFLSNHELLDVLKLATDEERLQLKRILLNDKPPYAHILPYTAEKLYVEITSAGGNSLANMFRQQGNSYLDILDDVAKALLKKEHFVRYSDVAIIDNVHEYIYKERKKRNAQAENTLEARTKIIEEVNFQKGLDELRKHRSGRLKHAIEIEEKIIYRVMELSYEKMKPEEKLKFDEAVQAIALEKGLNGKKLSKGVAGLIVLGEMGGFTTYMLMSMFLSHLGMGVFGFSVFTGASSILGVILSPVGWVAVAGWVVWGVVTPSKTKMAKIVVTIALIRMRLIDEKLLDF